MKTVLINLAFLTCPVWAFLPLLAYLPRNTSGGLLLILGAFSIFVGFMPTAIDERHSGGAKLFMFLVYAFFCAVVLYVAGLAIIGNVHSRGA
jgi:hypothetical protein